MNADSSTPFLELYESDADIGHQLFDLKMTDRVNMRMVGVPESSFDDWAARFVAKGYVQEFMKEGRKNMILIVHCYQLQNCSSGSIGKHDRQTNERKRQYKGQGHPKRSYWHSYCWYLGGSRTPYW